MRYNAVNEEIKKLKQQLAQYEREQSQAYDELEARFKTADKKERERLTFELPEMPYSMYCTLTDIGHRTGSTEYCTVEAKDEDWVINMPPKAFGRYALGDIKGWDYSDMSVLYAHYEGKLLNILCMELEDEHFWVHATAILKNLARTPEIQERLNVKWARVMIFRALKDALKPPREAQKPMHYSDAIANARCCHCGRESIAFLSAEYKVLYQVDGICDRCRTELSIGRQI